MARMEQWLGLDVCQRWLDGPIRPQGASFRRSNTERGLQALLVERKAASAVGRVILASTGG